jgi:hypothetical protein
MGLAVRLGGGYNFPLAPTLPPLHPQEYAMCPCA